MSHALKLLGLGLGASEMEVKIHYRQLAREYHPNKNNQEVMGLTVTEASDFFKLLNNANMFLRGQM
jgi:DnaJ-class molecular chaperone